MHVQRITQLISHLEQTPPENFNMTNWFSVPGKPHADRSKAHERLLGRVYDNWCGTAACIAGHTNLTRKAKRWYGPAAEGEWLGLTQEETKKLFIPWNKVVVHTDKQNREEHAKKSAEFGHNRALNTLRHMVVQHAATGQTVINWNAPTVTPEAYAAALNPAAPPQPLPESLTSLLRPEPKAPVEA